MKRIDFIKNMNAKEIHQDKSSFVLKHSENLFQTCYCQDDDVTAVQLFATVCVSKDSIKQIKHTESILKVFKSVLSLLCEYDDDDIRLVMNRLGFFDLSFKFGKEMSLYDYLLKAEVVNGLFIVTIAEV
ncbi:hypothetical protein AXI73_gp01 [Erysipelothrix amsterdamensis]|uniref:Uncharacterized protein n=1 Tax=Erysipelothrix amsterdamensis TaxID=2929157 RepID=A0AAU9VIK0_9FIRM|nr:hypothetical protein AXI73_gp01 [Erysipelothrix sp. A18Y020d]CAH2761994.1 hypothetical protein AXI73_gp01 [Erysipelothrix sp. A18Y020d]